MPLLKKSVKKKSAVSTAAPKKKKEPKAPKLIREIDADKNSIHIELKKGESTFEFNCSGEGTPYCCGLMELGDFNEYTNDGRWELDRDKDYPEITREEKVAAIKEGFQKLLNENSRGKQRIQMIFTLVSTPTCDLIEEAIDPTMFKAVRDFTNMNSQNENRLFISTN